MFFYTIRNKDLLRPTMGIAPRGKRVPFDAQIAQEGERMLLEAKIPGLNKPVSRILLGTTGRDFSGGEPPLEILDAAFELGVRTLDTARGYTGAEKTLGKWIQSRGNRDQLVILTKCCHPGPFGKKRVSSEWMKKELDRSLRDLQTDYADILLLHRDDPDVEVAELVEAFNELKAKGKIKAFGASNWTHQRIEQANEYAFKKGLTPFSVSSPHFGLAEQVEDPWGGGCVTITGSENAPARNWYRENQMPVVAYSSLGRGLFSGRLHSDAANVSEVLDAPARKGYFCPQNLQRLKRCEEMAEKYHATVPQIALSWLFHQELNTFAVVSTSSVERLRQNIRALELSLTEGEYRYLNLEV